MKTRITVLALFATVCLAGSPAPAADPAAVPETLDLNVQVKHPDAPGLPKDVKAVPGFSHRRHAEEYLKGKQAFSRFPYEDDFTCAACHHTAKTPEEAGSCLSCKTADQMFEAAGGPGKVKDLFHDLCRSCHKAVIKAKAAEAPTKCSACHK
ncbi:cytochrome c3 family protein [Deferrisoma sp.]